MTAPSFTYSGNVYTGAAAGTVDFALTSTTGNPIAYLEPSHIHVYKSSNQGSTWTELTRPAQWDFVTSGTVARLVTGIAAGDWVKVQRITPSSPAYVTFQSSSLLTAEQLNDDTLFNTYLNQERSDQGDQSTLTANSASATAAAATTTANAATTTANTALSTANTALSTANTASSNASAAVTTANTASTNASAAVTTANTASTNASAAVATANTASTNASSAVTTANTAASDASTALSTANTALSTANTALSTANTASTNASAAVTTANTASTNASNAVTTANTASTNATNAVNTANTASTNASNAVTTANTAISTANAAASAVASAILYDIVANVAAIPGSPANNDAVEVTDSTGIESFTPLAGVPGGFVGSSGLSVRLVYTTSGSTWNWIQYFPNDPESRYLKLSGGTLTGQLRADDSTSVASPVIAFDGDTNTGVAHTGADELALVTGGSARLTIDGSGNVAVPGTLGVTGAITGSLTGSASLNVLKAGDTMTGNLTAPALIPSGSTVPTNGVYLPAANSVALSTNGTGRLFIDSSGRVGVGTNSPSQLLSLSSGAGPRLSITDTRASVDMQVLADNVAGYAGTTTNYPLIFVTNNSERLRITSAGLVGVGTSSPGYALQVNGVSAVVNPFGAFAALQTAGGIGFRWTLSNNGTFQLQRTPDGFANAAIPITVDGSDRVGIGTSSPSTALQVVGTGRFSSGTEGITVYHTGTVGWVETSGNNATPIAFANGGIERARIDSSGRLGIGTSTPGQKLSVAGGNILIDSNSQLRFGSSDAAIIEGSGSDGTGGTRYMRFLVNNEVARFDTSGRFLVGTSSYSFAATAVLQGNSSASNEDATLRMNRGGTPGANADLGLITFGDNAGNIGAAIRATNDTASSWGSGDYPARLTFSTTPDSGSSPVERLRITNGGNVLVHKTSAGLGIDGLELLNGGGTRVLLTQSGNGVEALSINMRYGAGTQYAQYFYYGGTLVGNINVTSTATAYVTSSDYRLKENVQVLSNAIDRLQQLKPSRFNFLVEPDKTFDGFLAHEVQSVVPEAISGEKDAVDADGNPIYQGIDQSKLVPLLTAALQEAVAKIESLEARLTAAGL